MDEARALHASADRVGKTIVVHTAEGRVRVVIPASERLSLPKLREAIGFNEIRLATEDELAAAYPTFELGAVPPFGGPAGDRFVVDRHVAEPRERDRRSRVALGFVAARNGGSDPDDRSNGRGRGRRLTKRHRFRQHWAAPAPPRSATVCRVARNPQPRSASSRMPETGCSGTMRVERR